MIVILVVLEVRNEPAGYYIEELESAIRGIVPTILVGCVASGWATSLHARRDLEEGMEDSTQS